MSQFFNIFITFLTVLFLIYKYFTATWNYWKDRGVKYEKPKLIFGNYGNIFFGNDSEKNLFRRVMAKFPDEKMIGLFRTRQPVLLLKDLDLIRHVMIKDFNHFMDRSALNNEENEPLTKNLFATRSVKWRTMRKKLTPVFTSGKLRVMFPLVVEKANEFQVYLKDIISKDPVVDMRELLSQMTTDIIGSVAFGVEMGSMSETNSPFRRIGRKIFQTNPVRTFKNFLKMLFPNVFAFLKLKVFPTEIEEFFVSTVRDIVRHRETTHFRRNDFMDLLIDLKKQNKLEIGEEESMEFDDLAMTAQAFVFFAAGFETSSVVMGCTLNELALNPDILEKVIEEIDRVLRKHKGEISYDSISEMSYLDMCIYETMRKYPALATIPRVCTKEYTFPNTNVTIDKNVPVLIPALYIHYNPDYYPEPKKYIPERFSHEEKQSRDPMTFLGFGEGPRICIGLRFGKMQSMVGLVSILSKYKIEVCEKTEKEIIFNPKSFVSSPKNGVWLKLSHRKDIPDYSKVE